MLNLMSILKDTSAARTELFEGLYDVYGNGPGSSLEQTVELRARLPAFLHALNVRSVLDAPCGDFHWMKEVQPKFGGPYFGGDIARQVVAKNTELYATYGRSFSYIDIVTSKLPKVDLMFCRDCMVHFSNVDVFKALSNIAGSEITWLLTTNFSSRSTTNIDTGLWRPLNLCAAPFNLPPPANFIDEKHPDPNFSDKSMSLWEVSVIRSRLEAMSLTV